MGEVAEGGWGCGGILAGDIADGVVVIVLGVGSADGDRYESVLCIEDLGVSQASNIERLVVINTLSVCTYLIVFLRVLRIKIDHLLSHTVITKV